MGCFCSSGKKKLPLTGRHLEQDQGHMGGLLPTTGQVRSKGGLFLLEEKKGGAENKLHTEICKCNHYVDNAKLKLSGSVGLVGSQFIYGGGYLYIDR